MSEDKKITLIMYLLYFNLKLFIGFLIQTGHPNCEKRLSPDNELAWQYNNKHLK